FSNPAKYSTHRGLLFVVPTFMRSCDQSESMQPLRTAIKPSCQRRQLATRSRKPKINPPSISWGSCMIGASEQFFLFSLLRSNQVCVSCPTFRFWKSGSSVKEHGFRLLLGLDLLG